MKKLESLREWLSRTCLRVRKDPDLLMMFTEQGGVRAVGVEEPGAVAGVHVLSYRLMYKLTILAKDFPGEPEELFIPLLAWIARYEPDLMGTARDQKPAFTFEADRVANDRVHLAIDLELQEFVRVVRREDGGFDFRHVGEPDFTAPAAAPLSEVYLDGELIAEV